jgi:hypothetical protein
MSRPTLEVADIVRAAGNRFWEKHKSHFAWVHRKVLDAIVRCRTAALGGHLDKCVRCGLQAISYNSCRDRNCPKCQGNARAKWLAARSAELLPVPYFHIVFTLPHEFSALILQNKRLLCGLHVRTIEHPAKGLEAGSWHKEFRWRRFVFTGDSVAGDCIERGCKCYFIGEINRPKSGGVTA